MSSREQAGGSGQTYAAHQGMEPGDGQRFSGSTGLLFEQAMAQTRMAVCLTDPSLPDDPIVFCNEAFERLTGYTAQEVIGRNCRFLQGPDTNQSEVARLREALREEKVVVVELINYRKDGVRFWNALHLGPIYDENGKLKYFFGSQWDVSDVHVARAGEQHAKSMAREVSHRLKNVFAVIAGIVTITARSMGNKDLGTRINERIRALGRSYEPTLDDAFMGTIEVGQAVRAVLRPYDPDGDRILFIGNGARTEPNAISAIGLTLHELATNATKYGALSNESGRVEVSWHHEKDRHGRSALIVAWKEHGGPRIAGEPGPGGTGFAISEALLAHSRGVLDRHWDEDGLRAEISFPLADGVAR